MPTLVVAKCAKLRFRRYGENCARSLAPPFPFEPASLGFKWGSGWPDEPRGVGIIGPCMERGTNLTKPKRQGAREARGGKEGKREFDRCERQRAEDAAAPSSCPRRTNLDCFPNVRPGFGNHRGGAPGTQPRPNVVVVVGRGRARERTRNAHAWAFRVKRTL